METEQRSPNMPLVVFAVYCRLQQLETEYETLKENDPAELQKIVALTQVSSVDGKLRATYGIIFSLRRSFLMRGVLGINAWFLGVETAPKLVRWLQHQPRWKCGPSARFHPLLKVLRVLLL